MMTSDGFLAHALKETAGGGGGRTPRVVLAMPHRQVTGTPSIGWGNRSNYGYLPSTPACTRFA